MTSYDLIKWEIQTKASHFCSNSSDIYVIYMLRDDPPMKRGENGQLENYWCTPVSMIEGDQEVSREQIWLKGSKPDTGKIMLGSVLI